MLWEPSKGFFFLWLTLLELCSAEMFLFLSHLTVKELERRWKTRGKQSQQQHLNAVHSCWCKNSPNGNSHAGEIAFEVQLRSLRRESASSRPQEARALPLRPGGARCGTSPRAPRGLRRPRPQPGRPARAWTLAPGPATPEGVWMQWRLRRLQLHNRKCSRLPPSCPEKVGLAAAGGRPRPTFGPRRPGHPQSAPRSRGSARARRGRPAWEERGPRRAPRRGARSRAGASRDGARSAE